MLSQPLVRLGILGSICANLAGCGAGSPADPSVSRAADALPVGQYEPLLAGSNDLLFVHIDQLTQRFRETTEPSPAQARAAARGYTDAVVKTAEALLFRDGLSDGQRARAAEAAFGALFQRMETDKSPASLDAIVALSDRIIERFPKTELATSASFYKANTLFSAPEPMLPDRKARYNRVVDAVIELGQQDPPHPSAPDILSMLATVAEQEESVDRALTMHRILAEKFPSHEKSRFAPGNVTRLTSIGQKIEGVKGPSLDGTPMDLADLAGKVVLVDYWATWCGPCAVEMPELKKIRNQLAPQGFEILGINTDENPGKANLYLKENGYEWPQISDVVPKDVEPTAETSLQLRYGADSIPLKLLIDRDGTLIATGHSLREIRPHLERLFPELEPAEEPAQEKAEVGHKATRQR
jgi:thiol-disulfide isomerase/thioredoxin